jgi:hypothetical protein
MLRLLYKTLCFYCQLLERDFPNSNFKVNITLFFVKIAELLQVESQTAWSPFLIATEDTLVKKSGLLAFSRDFLREVILNNKSKLIDIGRTRRVW